MRLTWSKGEGAAGSPWERTAGLHFPPLPRWHADTSPVGGRVSKKSLPERTEGRAGGPQKGREGRTRGVRSILGLVPRNQTALSIHASSHHPLKPSHTLGAHNTQADGKQTPPRDKQRGGGSQRGQSLQGYGLLCQTDPPPQFSTWRTQFRMGVRQSQAEAECLFRPSLGGLVVSSGDM